MRDGVSWHVQWAATAGIGVLSLSPPMVTNAASPTQVQVVVGQPYRLPLGFLRYADVKSSDAAVLEINRVKPVFGEVTVFPKHSGDAVVMARLFGFLPWKAVDMHVEPRHMVYVGGQSIGVALHVRGAMVIGYQPGFSGGNPLEPGDVIQRVNGYAIVSSADLREAVDHAGPSARVIVRRGDHSQTLVVPIPPGPLGHRLGVYVRDKTAGIGTLTFYDPVRHEYGALGHVITDPDTGKAIEGWGSVYDSAVTGVVKGTAGHPGEKRGRFTAGLTRIADIQENTAFGLFGHMNQLPPHLYQTAEMVIALPSQVHTGSARILTVLTGQRIDAFTINIENVARQNHPTTRSMVIHVTDPQLIRATGGIIQGMSGSPIIQDGRLVGAVTHVFMSDSTRGYGIFAQWMANVPTRKMAPITATVQSGDITMV